MARTALVTGANRGIGLEACRQLARAGLEVVLTARSDAKGRRAAAALAKEGIDVRVEPMDVADEASVGDCAARLRRARVPVDVLVNTAGVYPHGALPKLSTGALRSAIDTNFFGAFFVCRAFVPAMVKARWGRVVNVSSHYGAFAEGLPGAAAYSISKAALNALTVRLAGAVPDCVKVNSMCPGWTRTRMGGADAGRTAAEACDTLVWLATLSDDGPTGGFFKDRTPLAW